MHQLAKDENAPEGLSFGDRDNNTTIHDMSTDNNHLDDDASDGDYSNRSDFDGVSLEADSDPESETEGAEQENPAEAADANYYRPIESDTNDSDKDSEDAGDPDMPHAPDANEHAEMGQVTGDDHQNNDLDDQEIDDATEIAEEYDNNEPNPNESEREPV